VGHCFASAGVHQWFGLSQAWLVLNGDGLIPINIEIDLRGIICALSFKLTPILVVSSIEIFAVDLRQPANYSCPELMGCW